MNDVLTEKIELGSRSYDVIIGSGALEAARDHLADLFPTGRTLIVTDENIAPLHLERLTHFLSSEGISSEVIILEAGETSKSFPRLEALTDQFLDHKIERSESVIALGGGVIGDLVGFASAITKRGIGFIQIPTTLLAQVDSSVGGKTGINTRHGKNFVGSFHQPELVIAEADFLETLPLRERRAGYAEIVKAALIGDADMFDRLEKAGPDALEGQVLTQAISDAIAYKAKIVSQDERETGVRALLNLGHTFAHAFEACAPKDSIRHGEAVAAGLSLAFQYAHHKGICPENDVDRVTAHLRNMGLPDGPKTLVHKDWNAKDLVDCMRNDKKNQGGQITLVLARGIGNAYIDTTSDEADLVRFMETTL